ncbi:MAG: T9SS type A sorting domain-containing protein, partial [Candidatus Paceibacterota bacterium]
IDLSGSGNASGNTENSALSGTIPAGITISALGIGSINTPLPVHFNAFDAYADKCNVQLHWSTAMEINNDYFTVERSHDGRVFTGIATVQSMGNSTEKQDYTYMDEHPADGLNYYRIRQVDLDGKHTATNVQQVYVHCNGDEAIKVFPTVSNNSIQVVLPPGYEDATVELLTTLGQVVKVPIEGSNLSYRIRVDHLASAMYMVRIRKGSQLHSYKIIKGE